MPVMGGKADPLPARIRADRLLVERGVFESRARAQQAIAAGLVTADGTAVWRASDLLAADAALTASPPHPYVSRGGVKLAAALDAFGIDPGGRDCLDVGASTGGFTEVLLLRGAARVHAVDVGRGQLHARIAADPRVVSLEATDIRALPAGWPPRPPDLVTIDVSFISLRLVLPVVAVLARAGAAMVALIKPQFEVGRAAIGRGGVVRDEAAQERACRELTEAAAALGFAPLGVVPSPIEGGDGNREFLLAARRGP